MRRWVLRCGVRSFELTAGRHEIGRDESCSIALDDELVSRVHAELTVTPEGVTVSDLGSRNGVHVHQRRLGPDEVLRLVDGDNFLVGQSQLLLLEERGRRESATQTFAVPPRATLAQGETALSTPYETLLAHAGRAAAEDDLDALSTFTDALLESLGNTAKQGLVDLPALRAAAGHALRLADGWGGDWLDRIFDLYGAGRLAVPIDVLTEIERIAASRGLKSLRIRFYRQRVSDTLESEGRRGRALLRELTRLERLLSGPG